MRSYSDFRIFSVRSTHEHNCKQIREWSRRNPSVALLVAATCFEWTLCRVRIGLNLRSNKAVRDWLSVMKAFDARNRLVVHGRDRYTAKMAAPHIEALLKATGELREFSRSRGCDVGKRLPIRRKAPVASQTLQ